MKRENNGRIEEEKLIKCGQNEMIWIIPFCSPSQRSGRKRSRRAEQIQESDPEELRRPRRVEWRASKRSERVFRGCQESGGFFVNEKPSLPGLVIVAANERVVIRR